MNKIFDTHVENKSKAQLSQKTVKKSQHSFSVLPLPFCKPNKKLFLNMPSIDMVKNVKANCNFLNKSIETSSKTKKKWILIRKHWYKFESILKP